MRQVPGVIQAIEMTCLGLGWILTLNDGDPDDHLGYYNLHAVATDMLPLDDGDPDETFSL